MWAKTKWNRESIEHISMKGKTREEWMHIRSSLVGLGGSEIASVMGLDDYCSATRLFYDKVGLFPREYKDNVYAFMGRFQENAIVKLYEAYSEDFDTFVYNVEHGVKVRKVAIKKDIYRNPEYPWLFFNVDGVEKNTIIECKQVSGQVADKWELGFPVKYVFQVNDYMLLPKMTNAKICILQDGVHFSCVEVPRSESIQAQIIEKTREFMERVEEGRKIVAKTMGEDFLKKDAKKVASKGENLDLCLNLLSGVEPDDVVSVDLNEFLSEKHKNRSEMLKAVGTIEQHRTARNLVEINETIKRLESSKTHLEVLLKRDMEGGNLKELKFPDGYVRWNTRLSVKFE